MARPRPGFAYPVRRPQLSVSVGEGFGFKLRWKLWRPSGSHKRAPVEYYVVQVPRAHPRKTQSDVRAPASSVALSRRCRQCARARAGRERRQLRFGDDQGAAGSDSAAAATHGVAWRAFDAPAWPVRASASDSTHSVLRVRAKPGFAPA
jgi:hypothetical protein